MRLRRPLAGIACIAIGVIASGSCTSPTESARVTSISIEPVTQPLDALGATRQLVAIVLDQHDKPMIRAVPVWTSDAVGIATVSPAGLVTAVANGSATVTATLNRVTATVSLVVAQAPVSPVPVSGDAQSGTVLQALPNPIRVRIEDRLGNPMTGRTVSFVVSSGGGAVGAPSSVSDANGLASTTWTLGGSTASAQQVAVTVEGNASPAFFSATALAGPPAGFALAPGNRGDGQYAMKGRAVEFKPAVKIFDALGNGVAGATVNYTVLSGGGSLTGGSVTTDAYGVATVGSWTLGPTVGPNTLQASFGAFTPVVFAATATEDPCTPAGARPIAVGQSANSLITGADCVMSPGQQNYEYYRLDLAAPTPVVMDLMSSSFDAWLSVYDFNTLALIVEHDDIVPGVVQNSRIGKLLPAGSYLLRARTFDPGQSGDFTLALRLGVVGVPAAVEMNTANGQVAAPGTAVPVAPSITVRDEVGLGVAGIGVSFTTALGVGSVTGADAITDANGVATVGSWTLAAGANALAATVATAGLATNPLVFSATGKASTAAFDISLRFVTMPTATQLLAFNQAAARWEAIITGDIAAQAVNLYAGECHTSAAMNETIDDLAIVVRLQPIDGAGQILGQAGPCAIRQTGALPALGAMMFDTADLAMLEGNGNLGTVILHEMGHVLGVGTIWRTLGLLKNPSLPSSSGADTYFSGANAIAGFNAIGGATWTGGSKVPVENSQGGAGTRDSHWRESVLQNELMTGYMNSGANPLSLVTARSMQDLGYAVNTVQVDAFFLSLSLLAPGSGSPSGVAMGNDLLPGGYFRVDLTGRPIGVSRKRTIY